MEKYAPIILALIVGYILAHLGKYKSIEINIIK